MTYGAHGRLLSVGGRPVDTPPPRLETRAITRHFPDRDLLVSGIAVPYGVPLPNNRGGFEVFTLATEWELPGPTIPLKLEHRTYLGAAEVREAPSGMHIVARVLGVIAHMVEQRRELSAGFTGMEYTERRDGVHEWTKAILFECSLVGHAAHRPHTFAAVSTAPRDDPTIPATMQEARRHMEHRRVCT